MLGLIHKAFRFALADAGSIKARIVRSGLWVGLSVAISALLSFVRSIFLARLLTPEIFGLMGLANIAVRTIETFSRPGIAPALIARQREFDEASSTALTLLIARGVILALLLATFAPLVSLFYEADQLTPILQALSVVFIVGGFTNINTIARQKEIDFRSLSYLALTTNVLGSAVTIAAALWLRNVWALVIGQLATTAINTFLSYRFIGGRLRLALDWSLVKELVTYGKFITGSSIMMFIAAELDTVVLGKLLGIEAVGLYVLAYTLANLVTANLSKTVSSVMMPVYSKLQADVVALKIAFLRSLAFVMFLVLPICAGLILVAVPLIRTIYGDRWVPAAGALQILAVFGLLRSLASFSGYLFEGIGKPSDAFYVGMFRLAVVGSIVIPMVLWLGLIGAAVAATFGVAAEYAFGLMFLRKHLRMTFAEIGAVLWRPVFTTLIMSGCVYVYLAISDGRPTVELVAAILIGAVVYASLNGRVLLDFREDLKQLRE